MTTIQIAHEVPSTAVSKIQSLLDEKVLRDVNWSGANLVIERSDFTCIPDDDSPNAVHLLAEIQDVIAATCAE